MRFDWDVAKSDRNLAARGFGFDLAVLIFEGRTIEWRDERQDYEEVRVRAVGQVNDAVLHVVFTDRDNVRRIISARLASRKERSRWRDSR